MTYGIKGLMLTTAIVAFLAPAAFAQDGENPFLRGRYTSVTERGQPEFDPEPVRIGTFNVDATLGASVEYNDNVFASPTNEESDTILRLNPTVDARSNWTSHELAAGVNVDHREFTENGSETATDYGAYLNGRLDVTRNFQLRAGVDGTHVTEPRYAAASFAGAEPASFDAAGAFVSALYRQDRFQVEGTVGVSEQEYDQASQQLRNNQNTYVATRVSYAISPDVAVFVRARRDEQDYDFSDREGTRTTVDAGVNFELAAPFRGEIAVGSFEDDRDSAAYTDTSGLNVAANVQWFPTQLTTVTFSANRGAFDPGLVNSATAVSTAYGIRVDHELLRNLLLFGTVRQESAEYEGIDREDTATSVALGAAWKLNKNARVEVQAGTRMQDSSGIGAGPEMNQNVISAGIRVYP